MKTISPALYALNICAAAMLAGCGGSAQLPTPAAQTLTGSAIHRTASPNDAVSEQVASNPASPEILAGKAKVKCGNRKTRFSAHGTATGSYPGTFTASGSWDSREITGHHAQWIMCCEWYFTENVTITSGSSTISGSMNGFGMGPGAPFSCTAVSNLALPYRTSIGNGNADIEAIQQGDFSETLGGLVGRPGGSEGARAEL